MGFLNKEGLTHLWSKITNKIDTSIANLINSAPETLDTLGELATAFQEHEEVVDALNEAITNKKNKDIIVTYEKGSNFNVTHSSQEIYEAVQNGTTVYFQKDAELLELMEVTSSYATFFMFYMTMEGKPQQKVVVISGNSIMLDQDDTYDYATVAQLNELAKTKANVENPDFSGTLALNNVGALGFASVSLGYANTASGDYSFAEGMGTRATGDSSHSEGTGTVATGNAAHAEGSASQATNTGAHAEGVNTIASGYGAHVEGNGTIASAEGQHVQGKFNIDDPDNCHIVGNGTDKNTRSNAHTVDWDGNAWYAGDVYVGSTSGTNKDEGSKKLATEDYVNTGLETKQNKNVIVTKDAEGKATMTPAEIIAHINAGDSVYFTENLGNDTYHPFLEGNARVSGFYSNYYDESTFMAIHFEIKSDRTITKSVWQPTFDEQIANHFLIVQTVKSGENYLLDGMTFEDIMTKFGEGINMVCRVDGTDYIPLLSVTPSKIMFSGIYQTTSVSLDFTSDGVGRLTSLGLATRDSVTTAISNHNTNKRAHSEIFYTKTEIDNMIPVVEAITIEQIDEICGVVAAN